jgi:secreted trypsin-like serine protease
MRTISANKLIKGPLGTILVAALLAATVSFFVSAQSGEAASAADDRSSAAKPSYELIGGRPVPLGKYPFVAWLQVARLDGTILSLCAGSLIDPDSVLTAAHCVHPLVVGSNKIRVDLVVGRTVLRTNQGQMRFVPKYFRHPRYDPRRSFAYDVVVLKLERAVTGIAPIKLASSSQNYLESPGREATVVGWGKARRRSLCAAPTPGGVQPHMLEAQVPILSDSEAAKTYKRLPPFSKQCPGSPGRAAFVPSLMISAGTTSVGACQGDSGGPLFVRTSREYTQIGIVSFGAGCAGQYPAAYTEVNSPSIRRFIIKAASR